MSQVADTSSGVISRGTAKELVVARLREQIVSGELPPGEHLNLRVLTEQLGVSMTPIREAIEQLIAEGLIRSDRYKGAWVTELSAEEYQEVYLSRIRLEGLAHRLGAEQIDAAGCNELEECLTRMSAASAAGDVDEFIRHDRQYHQVIFEASGRESLRRRIMALRYAAERYTRAVFSLPVGGMVDTINSHHGILAACRKHDGAEAERLITEDMQMTYESFAQSFSNNDGNDLGKVSDG